MCFFLCHLILSSSTNPSLATNLSFSPLIRSDISVSVFRPDLSLRFTHRQAWQLCTQTRTHLQPSFHRRFLSSLSSSVLLHFVQLIGSLQHSRHALHSCGHGLTTCLLHYAAPSNSVPGRINRLHAQTLQRRQTHPVTITHQLTQNNNAKSTWAWKYHAQIF